MKQSVPEENERRFWQLLKSFTICWPPLVVNFSQSARWVCCWTPVGKAKQTNMAKTDLCFLNLIPTDEPTEIEKLLIKTRTRMRRQMKMMVYCGCWEDLLLVFKLGEALISCAALRLNGLNSSSYRPNPIVRVTVEPGGQSNQRDWCSTKFTLQYGFEINHFQWLWSWAVCELWPSSLSIQFVLFSLFRFLSCPPCFDFCPVFLVLIL